MLPDAPEGDAAAVTATPDADERYTIISSDCHAGGSHAAYREYLDPAFHEDFDAWRGRYKNPYKDLGDDRRLRNWDNEMRNGQQEAGEQPPSCDPGVVLGHQGCTTVRKWEIHPVGSGIEA